MQASLKQFISDMDKGVYNFTDKGKCIRCGSCCTSLLPLRKDELKALVRYAKRHHIHSDKKTDVAFDFSCPFYDVTKKACLCYEIRPTICKVFKCDKPQNKIIKERDGLNFDSRFAVMNLRDFI